VGASRTAIDLKRELKHLYNPPATEVVFLDVPPMNFLMIDGAGDPNLSADYQAAIEVLYAASYALKFTLKRAAGGIDYVVVPSEGLWWAGDMDRFSMADKMERLSLLTIIVCVGSSCYVRGSEKLAETLQRLVERESLGAGLSSPAPSAWNNVRWAFQSGWATRSTAASCSRTSKASFMTRSCLG